MKTFSEWKKQNKELQKKIREYKDYINEHKNNVELIWENIKDELNISPIIKNLVDEMIPYHDESKYSDEEFIPYRKKFFPVNSEEKEDDDAFNMALNHHYKNNPHHWQYWILIHDDKEKDDVILEMDEEYVLEMLCDWASMSYKFNNSIVDWYDKNKDNMRLHDNTKKLVESLLEVFNNKLKEL